MSHTEKIGLVYWDRQHAMIKRWQRDFYASVNEVSFCFPLCLSKPYICFGYRHKVYCQRRMTSFKPRRDGKIFLKNYELILLCSHFLLLTRGVIKYHRTFNSTFDDLKDSGRIAKNPSETARPSMSERRRWKDNWIPSGLSKLLDILVQAGGTVLSYWRHLHN